MMEERSLQMSGQQMRGSDVESTAPVPLITDSK